MVIEWPWGDSGGGCVMVTIEWQLSEVMVGNLVIIQGQLYKYDACEWLCRYRYVNVMV